MANKHTFFQTNTNMVEHHVFRVVLHFMSANKKIGHIDMRNMHVIMEMWILAINIKIVRKRNYVKFHQCAIESVAMSLFAFARFEI